MSTSSSYPLASGLETLLPQTPLLRKTIDYVKSQSPDWLWGHVIRSWLYAQRIATAEGVELNEETLGIAALLHDLGLVHRHMTKDRRFEIDGAAAAVEFLREVESDNTDGIKFRNHIVWTAIALHTTVSLGQHALPEISICQRGIDMDVLGTGMEHIPGSKEFKEWVEKLYPRVTMPDPFRESLCFIARTKPQTTYDNVIAGIGEAYVKGYKRSNAAEEMLAFALRPTDHTSHNT